MKNDKIGKVTFDVPVYMGDKYCRENKHDCSLKNDSVLRREIISSGTQD